MKNIVTGQSSWTVWRESVTPLRQARNPTSLAVREFAGEDGFMTAVTDTGFVEMRLGKVVGASR
jgi:hypothetical protein